MLEGCTMRPETAEVRNAPKGFLGWRHGAGNRSGQLLSSVRGVAVLLVPLLAATVHVDFWIALPLQLVLSIVYLTLGDSLPASMTAHMANNRLVFLLASTTFQNWQCLYLLLMEVVLG